MTLGRAIDAALDTAPETPGDDRRTLEVREGAARAEVDVVDADRIGVRVARVKVQRSEGRDIGGEARDLPDRLRTLPGRVTPVEVAPGLGGATLRTRPEDMRGRDFFQVDVKGPREVEVRRYHVAEEGVREPRDWTMTREQLGRLVDELEG